MGKTTAGRKACWDKKIECLKERTHVRSFFGEFRAPARGTFGRCPKSTQKDNLNLRFKNPRTLCPFTNLRPYTARSQNTAIIVAYDASTSVLRRCRLCNATVEYDVLYGGAMWASRPTKFYRWLAVGRGDHTPPHDGRKGAFSVPFSGSSAGKKTILLTKRKR